MDVKKERAAALWGDTMNAAKIGDVQRRAVDALVEQYTTIGGFYFRHGRMAWNMLCDVIERVFGKDGKSIVDRANTRLRLEFKDPDKLNRARAEHNHWRVKYIDTQLSELPAERAELILERETIVEPNTH